MKVKVLSPLQHNGQAFKAGSVVDLDDATAKNLVAQNVVTTGDAQSDGAVAQEAAPQAALVTPEQAQPTVQPAQVEPQAPAAEEASEPVNEADTNEEDENDAAA